MKIERELAALDVQYEQTASHLAVIKAIRRYGEPAVHGAAFAFVAAIGFALGGMGVALGGLTGATVAEVWYLSRRK